MLFLYPLQLILILAKLNAQSVPRESFFVRPSPYLYTMDKSTAIFDLSTLFNTYYSNNSLFVRVEAENSELQRTVRNPYSVLSSLPFDRKGNTEMEFFQDRFIGFMTILENKKAALRFSNMFLSTFNEYEEDISDFEGCSSFKLHSTKGYFLCRKKIDLEHLYLFRCKMTKLASEKACESFPIQISKDQSELAFNLVISRGENFFDTIFLVYFNQNAIIDMKVSYCRYTSNTRFLCNQKDLHLEKIDSIQAIIPIDRGYYFDKWGTLTSNFIFTGTSKTQFYAYICSLIESTSSCYSIGESQQGRIDKDAHLLGIDKDLRIYGFKIISATLEVFFFPLRELLRDIVRKRVVTRIVNDNFAAYQLERSVEYQSQLGLCFQVQKEKIPYNLESYLKKMVLLLDLRNKFFEVQYYNAELIDIVIRGRGFIVWHDGTLDVIGESIGSISLDDKSLGTMKSSFGYQLFTDNIIRINYIKYSQREEDFSLQPFTNFGRLTYNTINVTDLASKFLKTPIQLGDLITYETLRSLNISIPQDIVKLATFTETLPVKFNKYTFLSDESITKIEGDRDYIAVCTNSSTKEKNKIHIFKLSKPISETSFYLSSDQILDFSFSLECPESYELMHFSYNQGVATFLLRSWLLKRYHFYYSIAPKYTKNELVINHPDEKGTILDAAWMFTSGRKGTLLFIDNRYIYSLDVDTQRSLDTPISPVFERLSEDELGALKMSPYKLIKNPIMHDIVYILEKSTTKSNVFYNAYNYKTKTINYLESLSLPLKEVFGKEEGQSIKTCSYGGFVMIEGKKDEHVEFFTLKQPREIIVPSMVTQNDNGVKRISSRCFTEEMIFVTISQITHKNNSIGTILHFYDLQKLRNVPNSLSRILRFENTPPDSIRFVILSRNILISTTKDQNFKIYTLSKNSNLFQPLKEQKNIPANFKFEVETINNQNKEVSIDMNLEIIDERTFFTDPVQLPRIDLVKDKEMHLRDIFKLNFTLYSLEFEDSDVVKSVAPMNLITDFMQNSVIIKRPDLVRIQENYYFGIMFDSHDSDTTLVWTSIENEGKPDSVKFGKSYSIDIPGRSCNYFDFEIHGHNAFVFLACLGQKGYEVVGVWLELANGETPIIQTLQKEFTTKVYACQLKEMKSKDNIIEGREFQYVLVMLNSHKKSLEVYKQYSLFDKSKQSLIDIYTDYISSFAEGI